MKATAESGQRSRGLFLALVSQHDAHPINADTAVLQVRVDTAIPESISDPSGAVLIHVDQITVAAGMLDHH